MPHQKDDDDDDAVCKSMGYIYFRDECATLFPSTMCYNCEKILRLVGRRAAAADNIFEGASKRYYAVRRL